MYAIAAIGVLTIALSTMMIVSPSSWAAGILSFSSKPYFHVAEVVSRLAFGGLLIVFAGETALPGFFAIVGCVFLAAGAFLTIIGSAKHRAFAERSATFVGVFRVAGIAGVVFGAFVIWSALGLTLDRQ